MNEKVSLPRTLTGTVVSHKMHKTITVSIERRVPHPKYQKIIRRSTKIHAHDEDNVAKKGDTVVVKECRPISKTKSWILESIKQKAEQEAVQGNGQ